MPLHLLLPARSLMSKIVAVSKRRLINLSNLVPLGFLFITKTLIVVVIVHLRKSALSDVSLSLNFHWTCLFAVGDGEILHGVEERFVVALLVIDLTEVLVSGMRFEEVAGLGLGLVGIVAIVYLLHSGMSSIEIIEHHLRRDLIGQLLVVESFAKLHPHPRFPSSSLIPTSPKPFHPKPFKPATKPSSLHLPSSHSFIFSPIPNP